MGLCGLHIKCLGAEHTASGPVQTILAAVAGFTTCTVAEDAALALPTSHRCRSCFKSRGQPAFASFETMMSYLSSKALKTYTLMRSMLVHQHQLVSRACNGNKAVGCLSHNPCLQADRCLAACILHLMTQG